MQNPIKVINAGAEQKSAKKQVGERKGQDKGEYRSANKQVGERKCRTKAENQEPCLCRVQMPSREFVELSQSWSSVMIKFTEGSGTRGHDWLLIKINYSQDEQGSASRKKSEMNDFIDGA